MSGLLYMSEQEQGWWSENLRYLRKAIDSLDQKVEDRFHALDVRTRAIEEKINNGISDKIERHDEILSRLDDESIERHGATMRTKQIRNAFIKYVSVATGSGGLVFAALRLFGG